MTASGTIESEEDGPVPAPARTKRLFGSETMQRAGRRGRAGRDLSRPEPGAGSAGPDAAQRRLLDIYGYAPIHKFLARNRG